MTTQQWDEHKKHIDEHIMWPATKEEIMAACEGLDVEKDILDEIETKLTDGDKKYSKEEVKSMLVM